MINNSWRLFWYIRNVIVLYTLSSSWFLLVLSKSTRTIFYGAHVLDHSQRCIRAINTGLTAIELPLYEECCLFCGYSYQVALSLDKNQFRVHTTAQEFFNGTSRKNKHLVVFLPRWKLESGSHKLPVDKMTLTQFTLISTCHNSYCTDSSCTVDINYLCTYNRTSKLQNNKAFERDCYTFQDSFKKI